MVTVTKHIKNIYSEFELDENSTSANYALVQKEDNREITWKNIRKDHVGLCLQRVMAI